MDAIERQVLQVKRKNSTKCSWPDARFTVVGSVAWRSGPREVATGSASTGAVTVNSAEGCAPASKEGEATPTKSGAPWSTDSVAGGAQAIARKTEMRIDIRMRWVFMVISVREVITENPYEKINKSSGIDFT